LQGGEALLVLLLPLHLRAQDEEVEDHGHGHQRQELEVGGGEAALAAAAERRLIMTGPFVGSVDRVCNPGTARLAAPASDCCNWAGLLAVWARQGNEASRKAPVAGETCLAAAQSTGKSRTPQKVGSQGLAIPRRSA
jgi:hypothetical protein